MRCNSQTEYYAPWYVRRSVLLLLRETPLHPGHIELMANVTRFGAIVMPPVAAFYTRPATVEEIATRTAARALGLLGIEVPALKGWSGTHSRHED